MNFRNRLSPFHVLLLCFQLPSFVSTSAMHLAHRQVATPTQPTADNTLCSPTPDPATSNAADAANERGVPSFLNDIITTGFLPNHHNNMSGWFQYVWQDIEQPINPQTPHCSILEDECTVSAVCSQIMPLYWTQSTIVNFRTFISVFNSAFENANGNISDGYMTGLAEDFPIQVPIVSEATFLNNIGAALSIVGGTIALTGGSELNPGLALTGGVLTMFGGIFSDEGANLQSSTPAGDLRDLQTRLSNVYGQVKLNIVMLIDAVFVTGDLSAYPSRIFSGSQFSNPHVAFFDNGNFFYPIGEDSGGASAGFDLEGLISNQLLLTITGAAVTEANYYILKDGYDVANCPIGANLTGLVIDNSCFTLETAGPGAGTTEVNPRGAFSNQMAADTVGKLVDFYQVNLSDLYSSSYSCQNASNSYSTPLEFSNLELDITTIPSCFYSVPVFQVSPPSTTVATFGSSPCIVFSNNSTAKAPVAGLTFLPDNLRSIFTQRFCAPHLFTQPDKAVGVAFNGTASV